MWCTNSVGNRYILEYCCWGPPSHLLCICFLVICWVDPGSAKHKAPTLYLLQDNDYLHTVRGRLVSLERGVAFHVQTQATCWLNCDHIYFNASRGDQKPTIMLTRTQWKGRPETDQYVDSTLIKLGVRQLWGWSKVDQKWIKSWSKVDQKLIRVTFESTLSRFIIICFSHICQVFAKQTVGGRYRLSTLDRFRVDYNVDLESISRHQNSSLFL